MTKQTQHTPAPWTITKCPCGDASCKHYNVNSWFNQGGMVEIADARLIAAAPELLEALGRARYELVTEKLYPDTAPVIQTIDAAIAKARGQS